MVIQETNNRTEMTYRFRVIRHKKEMSTERQLARLRKEVMDSLEDVVDSIFSMDNKDGGSSAEDLLTVRYSRRS